VAMERWFDPNGSNTAPYDTQGTAATNPNTASGTWDANGNCVLKWVGNSTVAFTTPPNPGGAGAWNTLLAMDESASVSGGSFLDDTNYNIALGSANANYLQIIGLKMYGSGRCSRSTFGVAHIKYINCYFYSDNSSISCLSVGGDDVEVVNCEFDASIGYPIFLQNQHNGFLGSPNINVHHNVIKMRSAGMTAMFVQGQNGYYTYGKAHRNIVLFDSGVSANSGVFADGNSSTYSKLDMKRNVAINLGTTYRGVGIAGTDTDNETTNTATTGWAKLNNHPRTLIQKVWEMKEGSEIFTVSLSDDVGNLSGEELFDFVGRTTTASTHPGPFDSATIRDMYYVNNRGIGHPYSTGGGGGGGGGSLIPRTRFGGVSQ